MTLLIRQTPSYLRAAICLVFALVAITPTSGQCLKMASWNIQDLGRTKDDAEIYRMAQILRHFDFVAIQEVVAKDPAGGQKVAAIVDELDRMGANWDYKLSDPTTSEEPRSRERYAFLWKSNKLEVISAALDKANEANIVREPYLAQLRLRKTRQLVWVANFHSLPHGKSPEKEIRQLNSYLVAAEPYPLVFMGDWNLDETHEVWDKFYKYGLSPVVRSSPTTLKRDCKDGDYLNHAIDNIYYSTSGVRRASGGVVDFVENCEGLDAARQLSDHLVVWGELCF